MGFIISTKLSSRTHRKTHGQNSGSLKVLEIISRFFCHYTCNRLEAENVAKEPRSSVVGYIS